MANRTIHRVVVQMMSSHGHIEMVEVKATVQQVDASHFEGDLQKIEEFARAVMRERKTFGPWADTEPDFEMIGVLCAVLTGIERGRITWVRDLRREERPLWTDNAAASVEA